MDRCTSFPTDAAPLAGADLRLPATGRFWLKGVRLVSLLQDGSRQIGEPVDLRVEDGLIRAILPAGQAPCCAPGLCLPGVVLNPLAGDDRLASGGPASFVLTWGDGGGRIMSRGAWARDDG